LVLPKSNKRKRKEIVGEPPIENNLFKDIPVAFFKKSILGAHF